MDNQNHCMSIKQARRVFNPVLKAWKEGKKGENSLALEHRKKKRWSKVSVVAVGFSKRSKT